MLLVGRPHRWLALPPTMDLAAPVRDRRALARAEAGPRTGPSTYAGLVQTAIWPLHLSAHRRIRLPRQAIAVKKVALPPTENRASCWAALSPGLVPGRCSSGGGRQTGTDDLSCPSGFRPAAGSCYATEGPARLANLALSRASIFPLAQCICHRSPPPFPLTIRQLQPPKVASADTPASPPVTLFVLGVVHCFSFAVQRNNGRKYEDGLLLDGSFAAHHPFLSSLPSSYCRPSAPASVLSLVAAIPLLLADWPLLSFLLSNIAALSPISPL